MQDAISAATDHIRDHYTARPVTAADCRLGDLIIVKPDGAEPAAGLLWIMGFNGGETAGERDADGNTPGARRWFRFCREAAEATGSKTWIIGERTHWGSPNVDELVRRVGSREDFRRLLDLHSEANKMLLAAYRPKIIWLTGLATYMKEAVTNYGLSEVGDPTERDKRGTLWQEYVDQSGVPWLATIHPTGARMSTNEFARVKGKLAQLAPGVSVRQI
jgi:hypothetical protein